MYTGGPWSNLLPSPHQVTPLHNAAAGVHVDTVRYLVGAGGDINIKDGRGVSEQDCSTDCGLLHQR